MRGHRFWTQNQCKKCWLSFNNNNYACYQYAVLRDFVRGENNYNNKLNEQKKSQQFVLFQHIWIVSWPQYQQLFHFIARAPDRINTDKLFNFNFDSILFNQNSKKKLKNKKGYQNDDVHVTEVTPQTTNKIQNLANTERNHF